MKTITHVIQDPLGLHARPAGLLAKAAAARGDCTVNLTFKDRTVDAKRIMGLMKLGAKQGDTLTITCEGENEDAAAASMESFLKENL